MTAAQRFRAAWYRGYVRIVGQNREPLWPVWFVGFPVLATAAFALVYRGLGAPREYEGLVLLGGALTAFWTNMIWSMGQEMYWERESGLLPLLLITPVGLPTILAGMAVGSLLGTSLRSGATILIAWLLFQVNLNWGGIPAAFGITFIGLIAVYGLGMCLSTIFLLSGRKAWNVNFALQEPIYLATGTYFPARFLGPLAGVAGAFIPLTFALDATRQILFPGIFPILLPYPTEIAILAAQAVIFPYLGVRAMKWVEQKARATGGLISRWE